MNYHSLLNYVASSFEIWEFILRVNLWTTFHKICFLPSVIKHIKWWIFHENTVINCSGSWFCWVYPSSFSHVCCASSRAHHNTYLTMLQFFFHYYSWPGIYHHFWSAISWFESCSHFVFLTQGNKLISTFEYGFLLKIWICESPDDKLWVVSQCSEPWWNIYDPSVFI